jgi:hypothetical protein
MLTFARAIFATNPRRQISIDFPKRHAENRETYRK